MIRLRRAWLAVATLAGLAVRAGARVLPGLAIVTLTAVGVGLWLDELGAGLTVAGLLLLADRAYDTARGRGER